MISEWQPGQFRQSFVRMTNVQRHAPSKPGQTGRTTATLQDASGTIDAVDWEGRIGLFASGFYAVKGFVTEYRGKPQVKLDAARPVTDEDREHGFDQGNLILSSPIPLADLTRRLGRCRKRVSAPRQSILSAFDELFSDRFETWPAATKVHHAYRRGLMEHTTRCTELAWRIGRVYRLDLDVLILGALFHDLGKTLELGPMPGDPKTTAGELLGHIPLGLTLWRQAMSWAKVTDPPLDAHVSHLILSHHGKLEWGSPVAPTTPEAHVLHQVDMIDSRLAIHAQASSLQGGVAAWSPAGVCVPESMIKDL